MEKRLIIAIVMSVLIIVSFQHFTVKPTIQKPAVQDAVAQKEAVVEQQNSASEAEIKALLRTEKTFVVDSSKMTVTFSDVGGSIKEISLKDYKDLATNKDKTLTTINDPKKYILSINDPLSKTSLDKSIYSLSQEGEAIVYKLNTPELEIIKQYRISKDKYGIRLDVKARNISDKSVEFSYSIIGGAGLFERTDSDKRYLEVISKINGKIINYKKPKEGKMILPGSVDWAALKNKYFSLILKPSTSRDQFYYEDKKDHMVMGVDTNTMVINPGYSIQDSYILYAGPSHLPILKTFGYNFEETINYGFFGGIAKFILIILAFFNNIVHSWGFSIILLAVVLNLVLFPLSTQSFKSMKKMQELQPQIEKLRTENKDNPQKLNKEIMELYKKYNVNPLSGCLPILLQMPIFVALYQALMKSVDLMGARFLWIKDLSSPDAVPLPFSLPLVGNSLNILPIIMAVLMFFQQKLSSGATNAVTEEQKQQQKMMLIMMPIIFGFIFYGMPSGLVLYWLFNTMLSAGEQYFIFKKS